MKKFVKNM